MKWKWVTSITIFLEKYKAKKPGITKGNPYSLRIVKTRRYERVATTKLIKKNKPPYFLPCFDWGYQSFTMNPNPIRLIRAL
jgi:hypothetical protein